MQAILNAAKELIGKHGNDAVSMREIAARARVPIASVYDYFPDKNAIIRSLMVTYLEQIAGALSRVLDGVAEPADLPGATDAMIDVFVAIFRRERELATIWAAVQANTTLRDLDVEDGKRIADLLAARFCSVAPDADGDQIADACLYAVSTIATTARLAIYTNPRDGARLLNEFKCLMRLRLENLLVVSNGRSRNLRSRRVASAGLLRVVRPARGRKM